MANLISRATGNWLTAGTWGLVNTTSLLISRATNAVVPTSGGASARSSGFTPGAITIDGIAINIANRTGTTGTMTVELWNNTGSSVVAATTVTINVSDLPAIITADNNGGWTVFAFASVLLLAATEYMVQITTSTATQVSVFANATTNNWARLLRTTTTQAPTTGDDMVVAGELTGAGTSNSYTVTMNSTTATDYGSGVADGSSITPALCVSCKGTLTFGTTAATNYILRLSGNLANALTGTINVGTTGTPMPRDSTAVVEFDCAADADFGWHNHGGTCNIQGLSRTSGKNVVSCKLNTDEAVAQTVLGVDTDTGWLSGDVIAIAPTSRTSSEGEARTLSANATATELTVSSGLTNAHSGTAPTQAEVILLTRNVKIRSVLSTAVTFMHNDPTATVDCDWAEFSIMGEDAIVDWRGVSVTTTTGSFNMQFCSLHDFEDQGIYINSSPTGAVVFSNNVLWSVGTVIGNGGFVAAGFFGANITIHNNIMLANNTGFTHSGWLLNNIGITFTDNVVTGAGKFGADYSDASTTSRFGTFSGQVYHSNGVGGLEISTRRQSGVLSSYTIWRNATTYGIGVIGAVDLLFDNFVIFGDEDTSIQLQSEANIALTVRNLVSNGDTSFSTQGAFIIFGGVAGTLIIDGGDFSTVGGIKTAHTTADIWLGTAKIPLQVIIRNTKMSAATEVENPSFLSPQGSIQSQKHDQVAGSHKTWLGAGTLSTDTTIFNNASPSLRMTPTSATNKLESASLFHGMKVAVNNGGTVTVSVRTRRSSAGDGAAYNGAQPRLIVKANPALGASFNSDTVLDTHTAADGTWETLTGTTASVTDDGVIECVVDADGTAGWINVDDFSVS
jgi:hypothetical protein